MQAQFDAGELITQRELVSQRVSEDLTERANQFGLILDDISLVIYGLSSLCHTFSTLLLKVLIDSEIFISHAINITIIVSLRDFFHANNSLVLFLPQTFNVRTCLPGIV